MLCTKSSYATTLATLVIYLVNLRLRFQGLRKGKDSLLP